MACQTPCTDALPGPGPEAGSARVHAVLGQSRSAASALSRRRSQGTERDVDSADADPRGCSTVTSRDGFCRTYR
jgi:hypothetical protein